VRARQHGSGERASGSRRSYVVSGYASNQPLVEDYAVVALVPGSIRRIRSLFCGTTTIEHRRRGVRYATEFSRGIVAAACGVEAGELKPFEALLR